MKERPLDPHASAMHFLGAELRLRRRQHGLTVAALARSVLVSADLIGKVEKAVRTPGRDLIARCDEALHADGALLRLFDFASHTTCAPARARRARAPGGTQPVALVIQVVTDADSADPPDATVAAVAHLPSTASRRSVLDRPSRLTVPRPRAGTDDDHGRGTYSPTSTGRL